MGNIYFLAKEIETANEYYNRGYVLAPDNPTAVLCMARTSHLLEDYESSLEYYNKLKEIKPELAARFVYLDAQKTEGERAANITQSGDIVLWEEVE